MRNRHTIPSVCQHCGANFLGRADGRRKYCTRLCAQAAVRDAVPRIPCSCKVCGKIRMVKPSVLADGKGSYCSKPCRAIGIATHGETRSGHQKSPEYMAWVSIKTRCLNPNDLHYPNYGGRGITICAAWKNDFNAFLAYVGRRPSARHSIDRFPDNNGNYEPGNVRWATPMEQGHNRRTNYLVTFQGRTQCVASWSREIGIIPSTLMRRLKKWSIERAMTTPLRVIRRSPYPDIEPRKAPKPLQHDQEAD